jgi:hypothetical protein
MVNAYGVLFVRVWSIPILVMAAVGFLVAIAQLILETHFSSAPQGIQSAAGIVVELGFLLIATVTTVVVPVVSIYVVVCSSAKPRKNYHVRNWAVPVAEVAAAIFLMSFAWILEYLLPTWIHGT